MGDAFKVQAIAGEDPHEQFDASALKVLLKELSKSQNAEQAKGPHESRRAQDTDHVSLLRNSGESVPWYSGDDVQDE